MGTGRIDLAKALLLKRVEFGDGPLARTAFGMVGKSPHGPGHRFGAKHGPIHGSPLGGPEEVFHALCDQLLDLGGLTR